MDQSVTQWINAFSGSGVILDRIMIVLSQAGVPLLIVIVILQWWSTRERVSVRHTCVAAGLSFVIGLGLNQIILLFIHRIRPYDAGLTHLVISPSSDWSFPSDHATASFAIAASFLFHRVWRRGLLISAIAALICLSRVYVGTHYLTDIAGGIATAFAATFVVWLGYRKDTWADRFITGLF
jgi:undecaprenyl-diphosphatase